MVCVVGVFVVGGVFFCFALFCLFFYYLQIYFMVRLTQEAHFSLLHVPHASTSTGSTEECKNSGQSLLGKKRIQKRYCSWLCRILPFKKMSSLESRCLI